MVFKYGMKRDFNAWLATLGAAAPVKTLTELRLFNLAHTRGNAIKYGQSNLDISDEMDLEADRARYQADRAKDIALAGTNGIDAAMKAHSLDALLFAGSSGASIAAKPGYPTVIVPFGTLPSAATPPLPSGFGANPSPFGVSFHGDGVQRAAAPRDRVRVRAGDAPSRPTASRVAGSRGGPEGGPEGFENGVAAPVGERLRRGGWRNRPERGCARTPGRGRD